MLTVKENVLDRIEQSFELFTKNFKNIFLSYFIYKFVVSIVIWNVIYYWAMKYIDLDSFIDLDKTDTILVDLFSNSYFIIWVNLFLILILLNLILIIPFILGTFKTIKDSYLEKENISYIENIKYWFKNINNSFKTYWYMFAYVALIPSLAFIVWWLLLIWWKTENVDILFNIWSFILWFATVLFLVFSLYRWLKTSFSIVSAVDKDEYTKENFNNSVSITKNNWWRIVWNFMLLGLIISLIWWLFSWVIWIFKISNFDFSILDNLWADSLSPENIKVLTDNLTKSATEFSIVNFLISIIELIIDICFIVFTFVFTYLFYKRLEFESWLNINNSIDNISIKENIEL